MTRSDIKAFKYCQKNMVPIVFFYDGVRVGHSGMCSGIHKNISLAVKKYKVEKKERIQRMKERIKNCK